MTEITIGQKALILKGASSEYVTVQENSDDHKIMEDMVNKGWFNRAFISGGKVMYNIDGPGTKIAQKLQQQGF